MVSKDKIKELIEKAQEARTNDENLEALKAFTTTEISDALNGENVMDFEIKPIDRNMRVIGKAVTVKLPKEESFLTHQAIEEARPGDILVIETGNSKKTAAWGDVKSIKAMKKGLGGIIVDGGIRDVTRNRELGFPIFTRYIVPTASKHNRVGELNVSVTCGGVQVNPGDIVVGDENGVVVIPVSRLNEVIEKANEKLLSDEEKINSILEGLAY